MLRASTKSARSAQIAAARLGAALGKMRLVRNATSAKLREASEKAKGVAPKDWEPSDASVGSVKREKGKQSDGGAREFIYDTFFRRTSVYATVFIGAFIGLDIAYNAFGDAVWDGINTNKQYADVIPKRFPNMPPGTEKEDEDEEVPAEEAPAEDAPAEDAPAEEKSEDAAPAEAAKEEAAPAEAKEEAAPAADKVEEEPKAEEKTEESAAPAAAAAAAAAAAPAEGKKKGKKSKKGSKKGKKAKKAKKEEAAAH